MKVFILLIILSDGRYVVTQEFYGQERCVAVQEWVLTFAGLRAACFPKGSTLKRRRPSP